MKEELSTTVYTTLMTMFYFLHSEFFETMTVQSTQSDSYDCSSPDISKWTTEHQNWCCSKQNIGCNYNCDDKDQEQWSEAQQAHCCHIKNIGCSVRGEDNTASTSELTGVSLGLPFLFIGILSLLICGIISLGRSRSKPKISIISEGPHVKTYGSTTPYDVKSTSIQKYDPTAPNRV